MGRLAAAPVCYRKSVRFEELVGQEQAPAILRRALVADRLAHAYLFEGPAGVGKRSAAVGLGMALNCERSREAACGACESCRRIDAGLHPDVVTIVAEGAQIVMEQAQQIVALGQQRPHEARARVIIVDDADRLNANASNCLLKTLEEPLRGTHIVLVTTAPDKLLVTIRSRAQRIRFRRVSEATLQAFGAARGVDTARAAVAAALATVAGAPELAVLAGDPEVAALLPTNLKLPQLGRALEAIAEADTALLGNVNATMALERLLLALRREERLA